ncbi:DUF2877 domain-containing protein [Alkaliphilus sp. B6464]|uniref:DUF2877 domain-containing protein n=1 Tax=Alkaliphilus sp. B6464 TaxID=2731219 RepID=UPI001BAC28B5|nr:DUF2877 domain-containing protein [Alkaliphilus sp. B6464]QUH18440.1 DUF2877 domain-containing protein [Alkaliphilus sp. B6464]
MRAIWICANTKKLIEERTELMGSVHSVFNRTCNIITDDDLLITIISSQIPNTPRSISINLPEDQNFHSFGLQKGIPFILNETAITVGIDHLKIDLSKAKIWDPNPILDFKGLGEDIVFQNIELLKRVLVDRGNFNGIAPIFLEISNYLQDSHEELEELQTNHYCSFIYSKIQKLIELLIEENIEGISIMAKQIIGFGPGLTPSTDDFLTGLMVSMLYARKYSGLDLSRVYKINRVIVDGTVYRTTKVSSEMLQFASTGKVADHIRKLMISLFSEKDKKQLIRNICSVIETGETSGSDLIAGAYIGCILTLYNRKESKKLKCI